MIFLNRTHNPDKRAWLASANIPNEDFPLQNLPFGVFRPLGSSAQPRCGVAIGDQIVDLSTAAGTFHGGAADAAQACADPVLNRLMAMAPAAVSDLRGQLFDLLAEDAPPSARAPIEDRLVPMAAAELFMPVRVRGYTDFFASLNHATNAGRLFRPDEPLLPNYKYVPVGYNGRASSVQMAGPPIARPWGQVRRPGTNGPAYVPSERLDYEVELAAFIGPGSQVGNKVRVGQAWDHVFGVCLLNDWSARDIQAWESQPLGPFLSKSFATSISPWIVTLEALRPFRGPSAERLAGDPAPLPHLKDEEGRATGALQILVDVHLSSEAMRAAGMTPVRLSRSDSATLYWTLAQLIAHHTSNGSHLETGDLMGSGTISGTEEGSLGCLMEISRGGAQGLTLPTGEERRFLADSDEITLTAFCARPGYARIGFGEARSRIAPASAD